jgi:rhamnosyltransferase
MRSSIAIIMRSKNEMPHIRATLDRLNQQNLRSHDLFVVDSGSTDGSIDLLHKYCDTTHLTMIAPESYQPGAVLNDAIARTSHDLVVLLNADAVPQSIDWLEKLITPILGNRADATFSKQIARPNARFIVAYDYERAYNPATVSPGFFSAAACAFRRELWERHRFRDQGFAEDTIWATECIADGSRICLVEDSVVEHSHNYTLRELFQKRYRQAAALGTRASVGKLMREIVRDLLHTCRKLRIHTIPYNIAYRITIYRAIRSAWRTRK